MARSKSSKYTYKDVMVRSSLVKQGNIYLRTAAASNVSTRPRKTYTTHPTNHAYPPKNYSTSTDFKDCQFL